MVTRRKEVPVKRCFHSLSFLECLQFATVRCIMRREDSVGEGRIQGRDSQSCCFGICNTGQFGPHNSGRCARGSHVLKALLCAYITEQVTEQVCLWDRCARLQAKSAVREWERRYSRRAQTDLFKAMQDLRISRAPPNQVAARASKPTQSRVRLSPLAAPLLKRKPPPSVEHTLSPRTGKSAHLD